MIERKERTFRNRDRHENNVNVLQEITCNAHIVGQKDQGWGS